MEKKKKRWKVGLQLFHQDPKNISFFINLCGWRVCVWEGGRYRKRGRRARPMLFIQIFQKQIVIPMRFKMPEILHFLSSSSSSSIQHCVPCQKVKAVKVCHLTWSLESIRSGLYYCLDYVMQPSHPLINLAAFALLFSHQVCQLLLSFQYYL